MKLVLRVFAPLAFLPATFAAATNNITQVQHVIIVIQENRTPDNLFNQDSTLAANGGDVVPSYNNSPNSGPCFGAAIPLQPTQLWTCWDTGHNHARYPDWINMWDYGKMDDACDIHIWDLGNGCDAGLCYQGKKQYCPYTYVDNYKWDPVTPQRILDPYFQIANHFGWANLMFQTNQGPSLPAHQFLFSGTSAPAPYISPNPNQCYDPSNSTYYPCYQWFDSENQSGGKLTDCIGASNVLAWDLAPNPNSNKDESYAYTPLPPVNTAGFPCFQHATLVDFLDPAGVSWKYYARSEGQLWTAPSAIQSICSPSRYGGHCQGADYTGSNPKVTWPAPPPADQAPILTDIQSCNLPAVSWVIPDGNWSDHAGSGNGNPGDAGPSWVAAIVNQVAQAKSCDQSGYWNDTVILVVWDDWGGYYDHVVPPDCPGPDMCAGYPNGTGRQYVYGFRVPLLVIGAYVKQSAQPPASYTGWISNVNHDFGSILNFIEYALAPTGQRLGGTYGIGGQSYPFADYFAPDTLTGGGPDLYGLSDFFDFTQTALPPPGISGWRYDPSCFHNPSSCFSVYPLDPDNDASESN